MKASKELRQNRNRLRNAGHGPAGIRTPGKDVTAENTEPAEELHSEDPLKPDLNPKPGTRDSKHSLPSILLNKFFKVCCYAIGPNLLRPNG